MSFNHRWQINFKLSPFNNSYILDLSWTVSHLNRAFSLQKHITSEVSIDFYFIHLAPVSQAIELG